jgi:hypothetical protein
MIDHARRGGDKVEVELALQPLGDDLEMQQAEEAAAEAEAQRRRAFGLERERRVVEAEFRHGFPQVFEFGGVNREQAAEHHGLGWLEAGQGDGRQVLLVDDGVADAGVRHLLDRGGEEADFAGAKLWQHFLLRAKDAEALDGVVGVGGHQLDLLALLHHAFPDAHQHDHAQISVIPAVDQHRDQRLGAVSLRRRQLLNNSFEHSGNVQAGLRRHADRFRRIDANYVLDLLLDALDVGGRQVDLVEDRQDFQVVVQRLIDVGERLRFDALTCIYYEDRSFAGGERARHLIGEIDVARRVHQVQLIGLAVLVLVVEAHGLRLYGDAALLLDVHGIENLRRHIALRDVTAELD